jgi:hypothetical protein
MFSLRCRLQCEAQNHILGHGLNTFFSDPTRLDSDSTVSMLCPDVHTYLGTRPDEMHIPLRMASTTYRSIEWYE